jgi:hypothetical protein
MATVTLQPGDPITVRTLTPERTIVDRPAVYVGQVREGWCWVVYLDARGSHCVATDRIERRRP